MNISQLFESDNNRITLSFGKQPTGDNTPAGAFMADFEAETHEHPFTRDMRYFVDGPVLVKVTPSRDEDDEIDLHDIQSKAKGAGARALTTMCAIADKHRVSISLYAQGYGDVPTDKLIEYYKRFGFEERNEFMGDGQDMVRHPR